MADRHFEEIREACAHLHARGLLAAADGNVSVRLPDDTVLLPFLPSHRLLLLSRHGALAWGESMEEAVNGIERVEHSALILKAAEELGGSTPLPPLELEALRALRTRIGPRLL